MFDKAILVYLIIINAAAFLLMLADKCKAKRGARRIRESTLLLVAVIGGSIGALCGMHLCRHKTQHLKFLLGLPLILMAHILLAIFMIK